MDMKSIRWCGNSRTSLQDMTINFTDDFASLDLDRFFRRSWCWSMYSWELSRPRRELVEQEYLISSGHVSPSSPFFVPGSPT
jgi:hypothetical protein